MTDESKNTGPTRNRSDSASAIHRVTGIGLFVVGGLVALALGEPAVGATMITAATGLAVSLNSNYRNSDKEDK